MSELILTPEKLYYLGTLLQAKYIDYAYIAAMDDVAQNYSLFEKEACTELVKAGVLIEDFSGNTEIKGVYRDILSPVFFGETETSIDICNVKEGNKVSIKKFHHHDGKTTMVQGKDKELTLSSADCDSIKAEIEAVLAEDYSCEDNKVIDKLENDKITRVIAVKRNELRKKNVVKLLVEYDGIIYDDNAKKISGLSKEQFTDLVYSIVKEAD